MSLGTSDAAEHADVAVTVGPGTGTVTVDPAEAPPPRGPIPVTLVKSETISK